VKALLASLLKIDAKRGSQCESIEGEAEIKKGKNKTSCFFLYGLRPSLERTFYFLCVPGGSSPAFGAGET
jgi:hypothetical protein